MLVKSHQKRGGRKGAAVDPAARQLQATSVEKTLLADVAFTQSKTSRSDQDYLVYAAARQEAWKQRKRRKFLGLF